MSIKEILKKCKSFFSLVDNKDIFIVLIIILSSLASFGLGRLSKIEESRSPIIIENTPIKNGASSPGPKINLLQEASIIKAGLPVVAQTGLPAASYDSAAQAGGNYVASKNGTKYYFPWCGAAQKISEKNKISFASKEEAEKAGYEPAANCKGL